MRFGSQLFSAAVLGLALASNVSATTLNFGNSAYSSAHGAGTYYSSADGVGYTLTALDPRFSNNDLSWESGDGIGVCGNGCSIFGDNEIEGTEVLRLSFSEDVLLTSFTVSNLFHEGLFGGYDEVGFYRVSSSSGSFSASGDAGTRTLNFGTGLLTSFIEFYVVDTSFLGNEDDFSLQSVSYSQVAPTEVPEPASMLLLGSGLVGLVRARRRKHIAA